MSSQQPISFDLLYSIRETQLQHGLRSDDFAKYHAYCTGRIKTLRKQLKLCNAHKIVSSNKKKNNAHNNNTKNQSNQKQQTKKEPKQGSYVAPTQVTENNCKDPRSIILLALVVERCWAESEELRLAKTGPADGKLMQRHQGNANLLMKHSRARLSRAVQMTKRLVEVVDKVGDDALKNETHAYVSSIHGRFAFTSGDFASAKKHFLDARNRYHEIAVALSKMNAASSSSAGAAENKTKSSSGDNGSSTAITATNQQKQALAVDLRGECDDRIVTCMRSLGEDASSYKPSMEGSTTASATSTVGENSAACLSWLGREIPISNFQVQNALRRFDSLDVFKSASNLLDCAAAVEETNGTDGMAWWIYQQQSAFNKMQDSFDRAVGALNDAQDAVTAELTNHTTNAKASDEAMIDQLRLTQHCLKFRTLMCVVARAYLASWSLGSRFLLSAELLVQNGSNNKGNNNKPSSRLPAKRLINLPSKVTTAANFSSKEVAFTLQHVVSPIDVVRLFDTVLSSVEESLLLPGVDDEDVVEVLKEVIRSDRLFFVAAGWQVVGAAENEEALSRCVSALTHVEKVLNGLEKKHPDNGKANKEWIENFGFTCPVLAGFPRSLLVRRAAAARTGSAAMASIPQEASSSNNKLSPSVIEGGAVAKAQQQRKKKSEERASAAAASSSGSATSSAPSSSLRHVASDKLQEFTTCSAFTEFPPDFQAAPCKPAFVDIASTYAEDYLLGMDDDDETSNNTTKPKQSSTTKTSSKNTNNNNNNNNNNDDYNQQQQQQQAGSGGWLGWLRGS